MARMTNLAKVVRSAGLKVVEVDGWKKRSARTTWRGPKAVVVHHTATPSKVRGNYPTLSTVRNGRTGLPGPLSQLGLGRDGTVYVIAAGSANHNYPASPSQFGNDRAIGIEAEASGYDDWPRVQYDAYVRLVAALCRAYGIPADRSGVRGHKEATTPGRKSDPNFDMDKFRSRVRAVLNPPAPPKPALGRYVTRGVSGKRKEPKRSARVLTFLRKGATVNIREVAYDKASGIWFGRYRTSLGNARWISLRPQDVKRKA